MWPVLSALLLAGPAAAAAVPALGNEVTPDGRLDAPEWAGARVVRADGMRVRLGRRGDVLAVALELDAAGISSLLVPTPLLPPPGSGSSSSTCGASGRPGHR